MRIASFQVDLIQGAEMFYVVAVIEMPHKERDSHTTRVRTRADACRVIATAAYAFADEMAVYERSDQ